MIRFIFVLLVFTSSQLFSQTAEQIASQAASMGITSEEDIIKELQKRGMTVEDASRMALIQDVDYDEYISKFIVKDDASATTFPAVSEIVFQTDTSQNTLHQSRVELVRDARGRARKVSAVQGPRSSTHFPPYGLGADRVWRGRLPRETRVIHTARIYLAPGESLLFLFGICIDGF